MHRKKVKLKHVGRNVKNPLLTRSHITHSSVNTASTEMGPELNRRYHLGMRNLIAQCKLCGKKFINEPYLHAHHGRRHYGQPYRPQILDGSAALLEVEIKYLKHRLSALECQLLKREWQQTLKGKVKVVADSEVENKERNILKENETKVVETGTAETGNKSEDVDCKINKYEKEVEELKNMFFAQIKELKQASQQPTVSVSSEFVQTEDTGHVPVAKEKKLMQVSQQQQSVPVRNESVQTDVTPVVVPEKDDSELQNKLEERESVWRLRLAKVDEQHKQELKHIQDRLQQTYEEGDRVKQELEEKLKQILSKLAAKEEEYTQLLRKQSHFKEEVIVGNSKKEIVAPDNRGTDLNEQNEKVLNRNKILVVKNAVETIAPNNKIEVDVENIYEKETKIITVEKDKEDESDFEISLPEGFKQKENMYDKKNLSRLVVGNFCEDKFEDLSESRKRTEEHIKSNTKIGKTNKNNVNNIMDFLNETEENLIKTPVQKLNFVNVMRDDGIREVTSVKGQESDYDDEDEEDDEEEEEDKEEKGVAEYLSESGSSYSGSSESEEVSMIDDKPNQAIEFKQPVQRFEPMKATDASTVDFQDLINELYLRTLENMQHHLISQPGMLNTVQRDVEDKLRHRLKQLGVDPDWTGLPQATFQSKMAVLKHHQHIAAKSKAGYFTQRGQLARDLEMKRNHKDIGNCKVIQENILGKLKTKMAQLLKAYPKLANSANRVPKNLMETKPSEVKRLLHNTEQSAAKIVASSPKQAPVVVHDKLLRKELEEIKMLQQSANKLKMYALDEELSDSDSLSWSLSSVSKDISPGKGTFFHVENKMKSAMRNAGASSGNIAKKKVLFAEDARLF